MAFIPDNRNGRSESVTYELQTEVERQIGINNQGRPRVVFFTNAPQIITKTTYNVVGSKDDWETLINNIETAYNNIIDVPRGIFTESFNISGGWFIINNDDYFAGSYVNVDYSNLTISTPGDEYKVIINESANVSPSGYLPDGTSYYNGSIVPKRFSRTSVCTLTYANTINVGETNTSLGGFITSKSISNPRLFGTIDYVDLSLEIAEIKSSINLW